MKKRNVLILVGMLAMTLTLGIVLAGCENQVQPIEGGITATMVSPYTQKAAAPSSVTGAKGVGTYTSLEGSTTSYYSAVVTWAAAESASGYTVYVQEEGKKTIESIYNSPTNRFIYKTNYTVSSYGGYDSDDYTEINTDNDRWTVRSSFSGNTGYIQPGKKYRFGVQSNGVVGASTSDSLPSDIVWSEYVQF